MVPNKKMQHIKRTRLSTNNTNRKSSICQVTSSTRSKRPSTAVQSMQYSCEEKKKASAWHNKGKETKSHVFDVDVVDGFAIFSFERYEDIKGLSADDFLDASLVSRQDESPETVSSITVPRSVMVPSTSSSQIKVESDMNFLDLAPSMASANLPSADHGPVFPLVNIVESSTTVSEFTTVLSTSSNQIKMEPYMESADFCMSQSVSEHIGLNQNNEDQQCFNVTHIGNAMKADWILDKFIKIKKKLNEERRNGLRLKQDYEVSLKEMENKNALLTSQIQSLNAKNEETVIENQNLKNEFNILNISLDQNKKLTTMELSQLLDKLKNAEELNDMLKKDNLSLKEDMETTKLSQKNKFKIMCKNYEDKLQALSKEKIELGNQCKEYFKEIGELRVQHAECQSKVHFTNELMRLRYQYAQSDQNYIPAHPAEEIYQISTDEDAARKENNRISKVNKAC